MTGETVPAQRRAPNIRTAISAGNVILQPAVPLEEAAPETMDVLSPTNISEQEITARGSGLPAETPIETLYAHDELDAGPNPDADQEGSNASLNAQEQTTRGDVWDLVARAQKGDGDALSEIYRRYCDQVFRFAYLRIGNRQVAEDLTAETFLRTCRRIGTVTWQGRDFGAWLTTIIHNLVADYYKSGRYRFEIPTGNVLDSDQPDKSRYTNPETAATDYLTNRTLLKAVQGLNPEQQECILLRFIQGYSVAETAKIMGKNEGAVKALQYRAVRTLRRNLPDGFEP